MRILLIDKSDSELIEQALKQERIPLDRMQPSESDDSIVIPEDIYDAAILTASDIAYSRGARTCERITALREENAGVPLLVILPHPSVPSSLFVPPALYPPAMPAYRPPPQIRQPIHEDAPG